MIGKTTRAIAALSTAAMIGSAFFAVPSEAAQDDELPIFEVGAAAVNINPQAPQYLGGFDTLADPTMDVHDPLPARAFTVERDGTALAFAIVDSQGWFAGYQEGPYGITDAREQVATWLQGHGYPDATSANVIISSTHSHAAPTIMGIWGPVDVEYLKMVHDNTIAAIIDSFEASRPATLWTANADVATIDGSNVSQTDIYDGWTVDGDLPVLWARDPENGKTIAMYANVPIHADIVNGADERIHAVSADHIGFARVELEDALDDDGRDEGNSDFDPTVVLAMGTLGRQESIVQVDGFDRAYDVAHHVTNVVMHALESAEPITDPTLGAAEEHVIVPGDNPILLGLVMANLVTDDCTVACPIDRSIEPPYLYGPALGTWVTAFRIGDIAYVSEPGEAFPEVSEAIRDAIGARQVRLIGMGQDQLGYYFPPEDATFTTFPNEGDHLIYNSSLALADETVTGSMLAAQALGFDVTPAHPIIGMEDPVARTKPGVQFFPVERFSRSHTVKFVGVSNRALNDQTEGGLSITWDFGDGTVLPNGGGVVTHTYQTGGVYDVTASVTDEEGRSRSWTQTVYVGEDSF
jgi:hypothetical protein